MTHDPMCSFQVPTSYCKECDLIAKVREDERASATVAALTQDTAVKAYAAAVRDAVEAVKAYADERLVLTKHPNRSEDITAALRVAADRVKSLGDESWVG